MLVIPDHTTRGHGAAMESINSRMHEKFLDMVYYSFTVVKQKSEINGLGLRCFKRHRKHLFVDTPPESQKEKMLVDMAPSVRRLLHTFTLGHIFADTYPVIRCGLSVTDTVRQTSDAWKGALAACATFSSVSPTAEHMPFIPVSYASHDSDQLVWGRTGVPMCASGDDCEARRYSGNQGPLHTYLTPDQQRCFTDKIHFDMPEPGFCLLCIRCEIHALLLAWESLVSNPRQQLGRDIICVPPMQNLVDMAGGYIREVVGISQSAHSIISNVAIVGITGLISVKYNPEKKIFFFDQSRIVWPQQHFLG